MADTINRVGHIMGLGMVRTHRVRRYNGAMGIEPSEAS
jgi:hypothetical protein